MVWGGIGGMVGFLVSLLGSLMGILVAALTFVPALALGPIAEALL